jgi:hypothetical protein
MRPSEEDDDVVAVVLTSCVQESSRITFFGAASLACRRRTWTRAAGGLYMWLCAAAWAQLAIESAGVSMWLRSACSETRTTVVHAGLFLPIELQVSHRWREKSR